MLSSLCGFCLDMNRSFARYAYTDGDCHESSNSVLIILYGSNTSHVPVARSRRYSDRSIRRPRLTRDRLRAFGADHELY